MHKGLQLLAADWTPPILSTICVQQLICHCCAFGRMLWLVVVYNYIFLNLRIYTVSKKKGATGFFAVTFTNIDGFSYFLCTTSQENAKLIGIKNYHHTFVMLLPYRVKVSDTKVTHFTPILALCTCLYRLHLRKPVLMKQTKHSSKSEAQNL